MDTFTLIAIVITGVAVGFINNLAGAAGAIGLLAFDKLLGLPLMTANATLRPAALAIGTCGMIGFYSKGHRIPGKMWLYALLTVPGAVLGSMLVAPRFKPLFQIILATLMVLVLIQQLRNTAKKRAAASEDTGESPWWMLVLLFSWLGAHMGFIQVATGLVAIFVLSLVHSRDLVQVNAAKMAFVTVAAITSNTTLAFRGSIEWEPAIYLAIGAGIGSFTASRWSVDKGHSAVRAIIVVICIGVLLHLGYMTFFAAA